MSVPLTLQAIRLSAYTLASRQCRCVLPPPCFIDLTCACFIWVLYVLPYFEDPCTSIQQLVMSGSQPLSSCFSVIRSVLFMTFFVASPEICEDHHDNILKHCPYAAHASTACISQKSGMSPPSLGSGRSPSYSTSLIPSHVRPSMINPDIFLRVPVVVGNLWRLCGAFVFLLRHARLPKTFGLMLPCSR